MLITHICPKNFLSFGPDNPGIDLRPLNVLIGANGSGKSNLIEAVSFLRSAPKELRDVTRKGGGASEWIWKGDPHGSATVEWTLNYEDKPKPLNHRLAFSAPNQTFRLDEEEVDHGDFTYLHDRGRSLLIGIADKGPRELKSDPMQRDRSVLVHLRDPETYPELAWLARTYEQVRIYREWSLGRNSILRQPQATDLRHDMLEEDFSNLWVFLGNLSTETKRHVLAGLQDLYSGIDDFRVPPKVGTVQIDLTEGQYSIPATRLSDGTLHYLCLLAILCDPEPPPLICIEEPELGLHPDILPNLANLMREASTRTQLIVTTHSDILVDAMSETPESVVVCSKENGQTTMERLSADRLRPWLEKYRLGQLWIEGEIGGNRW
jgi:predicted ATPase